ncbi:MAG: DUF1028 domain-containing protein [Gemmatimonadota bacterium]|nr:MAG: DUF1028 domain-containing protein [Gemmatimonadota bacterium]
MRPWPTTPAQRLATTLLLCPISTAALQQPQSAASPTVASYSILARDELTGEYGVAAASHAPLIGVNLEFLDPKTGGVVILGGPNIEANQKVLLALQDGLPPDRAIAVGLYGDEGREERQVLAISPRGAAAFSGDRLAGHAGHLTGEHFVAAGHRLAEEEVLQAMEKSFLETDAPLRDRLLLALEAGRDAGGEKDGAHSAALLVVGPGASFATRDRLVDLRIDFVPGDAVAALVNLRARIDSVYGVVK